MDKGHAPKRELDIRDVIARTLKCTWDNPGTISRDVFNALEEEGWLRLEPVTPYRIETVPLNASRNPGFYEVYHLGVKIAEFVHYQDAAAWVTYRGGKAK